MKQEERAHDLAWLFAGVRHRGGTASGPGAGLDLSDPASEAPKQLGLVLDLSKWAGLWGNKNKAAESATRYYPAGAPRYGGSGGTSAAVSSGQVPPSTSPTAIDSDVAPTAATTPPDVPGDDKPGG